MAPVEGHGVACLKAVFAAWLRLTRSAAVAGNEATRKALEAIKTQIAEIDKTSPGSQLLPGIGEGIGELVITETAVGKGISVAANA